MTAYSWLKSICVLYVLLETSFHYNPNNISHISSSPTPPNKKLQHIQIILSHACPRNAEEVTRIIFNVHNGTFVVVCDDNIYFETVQRYIFQFV